MKRLFNKVLGWFTGNRYKGKASHTIPAYTVNKTRDSTIHKTIQEVNELVKELYEIDTGYTHHINEIKTEYDKYVDIYDNAYEAHHTVLNEYGKGIANQDALSIKQEEVKQAEYDLRNVGHKLDEAESYRKEEINGILNQIELLEIEYVDEQADKIRLSKYKLQKYKDAYLNEIIAIQNNSHAVKSLDSMISHFKAETGTPHAESMENRFNINVDTMKIEQFGIRHTIIYSR